jgi:hypothetical protein
MTLSVANLHSIEQGRQFCVTGHGGPTACETSRLPHFLDNRLTDGGEAVCNRIAVIPTERPPLGEI